MWKGACSLVGSQDIWQLIVLVVLILMSAFFSSSETALMSLNKIRLRGMVAKNVPRAKKVQKLVENPSRLLGAILVGNNVVNIGASALATSIAIKQFGNNGVGIATGVMTFIVLVFGEITPKTLAAQHSEKISLKVANLLSLIVFILKPITVVLMKITNMILRLFGGKIGSRQPFVTEEEIKAMINVGHEEGVLEVEEREMIHNVFEFGETKVTDVMTPRTYMVAIDKDSSFEQVVEVFKNQRFSRIPVYEDDIDHIIGVLFLKDLFLSKMEEEPFNIENIIKEPYLTIEYKLTTELFREMRAKGIQMAIVIDEYGGTAGVVTIEDLVEEIVGDIYDESDEILHEIELINEGEYAVLGIVKIDDVNDRIGISIYSEEYDSIGGFVFGLFGRLPEEGESIAHEDITFVVEKVHKNRIEKLKIIRIGAINETISD
ncbi:MAG: hemolysin [Firmicutes bacterium HGW-Firmicutes-11]|jgi:putative hemolysin|nr:MAG: hemolysin [Firmicutes bacterium HGW-Firmicutes-11]